MKTATLPVILSTVGVAAGYQEPTIAELRAVLHDVEPIDREPSTLSSGACSG